MGALATGGTIVWTNAVGDLGIPPAAVQAVLDAERRELARRERAFRGDRPPLELLGRTVVLVDDGLATGATMSAAVEAVRRQGVRSVIVAVPVGPRSACLALARAGIRVVCPLMPEPFFAVGPAYEDFSQVEDDEVRAHLGAARERHDRSQVAP
jgi:putative phosphoribosyl transferase